MTPDPKAGENEMKITAKRLESGYWHLRGEGPCNWAQPPNWPCSEAVLRASAFNEASEDFIRDALMVAEARSRLDGEGEGGGRC